MSTTDLRKPTDMLIQHPHRMKHVLPVPQYPSAERPMPTAGERALSPSQDNLPALPQILPFVSGPSNGQQKHRHTKDGDDDNESVQTKKRKQTSGQKRGDRRCLKCGMSAGSSATCKGTGPGGVSKCENACQDCERLDCKGRNSRNRKRFCPNKPLV